MDTLQRILLLIMSMSICAAQKPRRPHVVFMIVDDLGWNDVSFHGSKQIPTPNIDAIAHDGIILNQHYVQPTCSPSRGALMTGKYPIRIGFQHAVIRAPEPWGLPLKEKILPQYLKSLNYNTHAVGKWHLGFFKEEYLPRKRGFDSFFGYYTGVKDYYNHFADAGNLTGLDLHNDDINIWRFNNTYATDLFTAKAKKIILEHNPTKPLFLYFAQQAPHSGNFAHDPIQAPKKYVEPLMGIEDKKRREFAGMVSALDYSVGEIFDALHKTGMLEDTIFIFTTDNGGAVEATDGARGSNWPLRGTKYNLWEGGIRAVAFLWSHSLRSKSRVYHELMHITDWLPTIVSAVGGPDALKMLGKIDGVDQWPSFKHVLPSPRQEILLNIDDVEGVEGIRKGRYKLVKKSYYNGTFDGWYDKEGLPIKNATTPVDSPVKALVYQKNYLRFLKRSKAARVLWRRYAKDPRFTFSCRSPICRYLLEVKCEGPRPFIDTCQPAKSPCLFDIATDPCEFYNIHGQLPEVAEDLEKSINTYRPFIVSDGSKPADSLANPKIHGNVWVPWK